MDYSIFPQYPARRYNAAMPILDSHSMEFISRGTEYTRRVGIRLSVLLRKGDVVCLEGDLGSGKTTFVQGVAAGWGSVDAVSSPTFVLVNQYRRPDGIYLFHLDAYRLEGATQTEDLDIDSMLETGGLIIEWADRIQEALPPEHLWISLRYTDVNQRDLIFSAHGARYDVMLATFRKRLYGGL
jgi:tRNA threonylcarbamoyladenosine biosynthesis protein TsaE